MDEVLDPRSLRLSRYPPGRFNVHRIECLVSPLNVRLTAFITASVPTMAVATDRSSRMFASIDCKRRSSMLTSFRVPRCNPNAKFPFTKMLDDTSTEKAGAPENGHYVDGHGWPAISSMRIAVQHKNEWYPGPGRTRLRRRQSSPLA